MRAITVQELDLIAGGTKIPVYTDDGGGGGGGEVVVIGTPYSPPQVFPPFVTPPYVGDPGYPGFGGGTGGSPSASTTTHLSSGHDVTNNVHRPLTEREQVALDHFKSAVVSDTDAFGYVTKNQTLHLDDGTAKGRDVKVSELVKLWQNSDFVINEVGTAYKNLTTRGESDLNGGKPIISLNIDILVGYDAAEGGNGIHYLPLHELGHLSDAAQDQNRRANSDGNYTEAERLIQEKMANDTAYAIQVAGGITPMVKPGDGYSANHGRF